MAALLNIGNLFISLYLLLDDEDVKQNSKTFFLIVRTLQAYSSDERNSKNSKF